MEEMPRQQYPYTDDEISLVDIARVLLRRKFWIIGTFIVCVLGALAFAMTKDRQYTYTTSILIGEFGLDKYVATPQAVKSSLENRIEPVVARRFVDKRDIETIPFGVTVSADEGNNFVNLKSEAPDGMASLVSDYHRAMADVLTSTHSQKLSLLDKKSSIKLDNLKTSLKTEEKQLESLQELLAKSTRAVEDATKNTEVTANTQGTDEGMEATLSSSNNSLTFLLSRMQLSDQLGKRERNINDLRGNVGEEQLKRSWIKPTRVVDVATASISPTGTSKALIVALGLVLGLMLGVFVAFFVEFISRVRSED